MKTLRTVLALIALGSLAVYVLACRSSFSPDGTKIVISAGGGRGEQGHLLMYDRQADAWSHLLTVSKSSGGKDVVPIPSSIWTQDGKSVIATWFGEEKLISVSVLPVGGAGPTRIFTLPLGDEDDEESGMMVEPPVLSGSNLLFGGAAIRVLNLHTGEHEKQTLPGAVDTNSPKKAIYFSSHGKQVCYLMGSDVMVEAGRLNVSNIENIRLEPQLKVTLKKEDGNPFIAVSEAGDRIAMTGGDDLDQNLLIYRNSQLERSFPFGADTNKGTVLGNLIWSKDGRTIYAAGFRSLAASPFAKAVHATYETIRKLGFNPREPQPLDLQVLVCEIPLVGSAIRETPLFRMASKGDESCRLFYQISLSPDGRTIAVSDGLVTERNRQPALYLLDVSGEKRLPKRIPFPPAIIKSANLAPE